MKGSTTLASVETFAGVDFHKKFSVVTLGDAEGKVLRADRVYNDRQSVRLFFGKFPGLIVAVESCRGYEWFVEELKSMGVVVKLANSHDIKLIAQSRSKSDRVDSKILMELLSKGFLPTCYQASPEEKRLRERLRWRSQLVRMATRMKVQIHSLIDKENHGATAPAKLFTNAGREFLENLKLQGPGRQDLLAQQLEVLDFAEELVDREFAWIKEEVKKNTNAQLLTSIPGIGEFSALVVLAELGEITRFKRAPQVVNFAGLNPSVYSSADTRHTGRITKQGSCLLRWVLIQDAWVAIRTCPPLKTHFNRVSYRCGKNGGIVAVARKLAAIAYRVLRDQKPFDPKLVGSQSK
jgi:transposase